jgi:MFS family permease
MDAVSPAPSAEDRPPRASTFASLAIPQFRLLLAGTALSQVADWMNEVARGWLVLELGGSAFQLGLLGFIRGITQLLFSPVAGVMADRLDRRLLATMTQTVPALTTLAIGILISTDAVQLWHLYVFGGIGGVAGSINHPTRQILVYDVVGGEQITNAVALNSVTSNLSRIVAPSVGGVLIGVTGIASSYYAQSVFFALATVVTLMLHPATHAERMREPIWQSLREGFSYVRHDPTVGRLVLINAIPNLFIYPYVSMMPIFAKDVLGAGSGGYGLLLTGVGFGSIPGGLLVAGMSTESRKGRTMASAALLYMGMVALFALSTVFALSFVILIVAGVGWVTMVTLNQTLLQLNVEDAYRGRVLSLYTMAGGFTPFGNMAMGLSAGEFGVQGSVAVFALVGFALAAMLGLGSARVRRL